MRTVTARIATTDVTKKYTRFTRGALEEAAAQINAGLRLPMLTSHDATRPLGWASRATVVRLGDDRFALEVETRMPETEAELGQFRSEYGQHLRERMQDIVEPFLGYARSLPEPRPELEADRTTAYLHLPGLVVSIHPELENLTDSDGLVSIHEPAISANGLIGYRSGLLVPDSLFRRSFNWLNTLNSEFLAEFARLAEQHGKPFRLRIDWDRTALGDGGQEFNEFDYWYGPPFAGSLLDQPYGVTVHGASEQMKTLEQVHRTEFYRYARDDEVVMEIEEIHARPMLVFEGSERFAAERYLHAVIDGQSGAVIHADGAVRLYTAEEWQSRFDSKIDRFSGGLRVKLFRVDSRLDPNEFFRLAHLFFRGNPLVAEFFGVALV